MDFSNTQQAPQDQYSLVRLVPAHESIEAETPIKVSSEERPASPASSDCSSKSKSQAPKDARIGVFRRIKEDGRVKQTEKIFKIIKEKDLEVDSDDDEST